MPKKPKDPRAVKISFRLSGADRSRTEVIGAKLPALREELAENTSVLWRLIYRAGLEALERDPRALLGSTDPDPTPRMPRSASTLRAEADALDLDALAPRVAVPPVVDARSKCARPNQAAGLPPALPSPPEPETPSAAKPRRRK